MKKIYTLSLMLLLSVASMMAQKNTDVKFITIDEDGNKTGEVADGAVITASTVSDDGFSTYFISAGLAIENTTTSGKRVQMSYNLTSIEEGNGYVQCCFPPNCTTGKTVGQYYVPMLSKSNNHINLPVLKKGATQDVSAEWLFQKDGQVTATFTVWVGTANTTKTDKEGDVYDVVEGPSVTVNFVKGTTGINAAEATGAVKTTYYDLSGRKVSAPTHGVYVKKTQCADGTIKTGKVAVK